MASTKMIMVVLSVVLMSWTTTTKAQGATDQSCIQALIPCQPYLASTDKPPAECCDPLTKAFETQLSCLCAAFTNPALAATFNMTQAIMLPMKCDIKDASPTMCSSNVAPSPGSSSASGPSSSSTPSKTLPSPPPPSGNGSSRSMALAGPISGLMMLLTGFMFY